MLLPYFAIGNCRISSKFIHWNVYVLKTIWGNHCPSGSLVSYRLFFYCVVYKFCFYFLTFFTLFVYLFFKQNTSLTFFFDLLLARCHHFLQKTLSSLSFKSISFMLFGPKLFNLNTTQQVSTVLLKPCSSSWLSTYLKALCILCRLRFLYTQRELPWWYSGVGRLVPSTS